MSSTSDPGVLDAIKLAFAETNDAMIAVSHDTASILQNAVAQQGQAFSSMTDSVDPSEHMIRREKRVPSFATDVQHTLSQNKSLHQSGAAGDESNALDPCTIGDQLAFKVSEGAGTGGFLIGDAAAFNLGVQEPGNGRTTRDALNYDEYVFRVCPMLSYRQHDELESMKILAETSEFSKDLAFDDEASDLVLQQQRTNAEELKNKEILLAVSEGRKASIVKYGDIVQLQHVRSGAFATVLESAAPIDPECRGVVLDKKGTTAALFKFMPRFKAQTEGSVVYYSHTVVLKSVWQRGMSIHASNAPYSSSPDVADVSLPKRLQTGKTQEVNLSTTSASFILSKYTRPNPKQLGDLKSRKLFRIWHSQSECFMQASCNTEKDRENPKGRASGEASHSPYLKKLPDLRGIPDPSDPSSHYPKAIWYFEPLRRVRAGPIAWDVPVRMRHASSGRYLAVDTSVQVKADANGLVEHWYAVMLVDDSSNNGDDASDNSSVLFAQTYDIMGNELGFKTMPASAMMFTATPADVTQGSFMPDVDCKLRICHAFTNVDGSSSQIYLHNTEERRSKSSDKIQDEANVIPKSFRLVFSSVRSAQDIFKLILVPEVEVEGFASVQALLKPACLYAAEVADKTKTLTLEQFEDAIRFLLKVIKLQLKGDFEWAKEIDWMEKASNMPPAAFAELFDGEPDASRQRISRDLKLMDAVFAMSLAMYKRHETSSPWSEDPSNPDLHALAGAKAAQKLFHVVLQRMCTANKESQDYFGRRSSRPLEGSVENTDSSQVPWMDSILMQLDDPLGSAVTLSKLISANDDLMERYANAALTKRFLNMIKRLGPQPRLINFFEAICAVGGVAVKANQELIIRLTWMNEEARNSTYLVTREYTAEEMASKTKVLRSPLPVLPKVQLPTGEFTDGKIPKGAWPKDYIGKEVFEHPSKTWSQVFVRWTWIDDWTPGNSDGALFWSPTALCGGGEYGIATYSFGHDKDNSNTFIRVEDLCWVLEPERLCEAITGKKWSDVNAAIDKSPGMKKRFKRHEQLASYYDGQLSLHAMQCLGRSYNCISWIEKSFSYTMLCSLCYNPYLPPKIRGGATNLVKALYLDRFPQLTNCGRPSLPQQLWVNSLSKACTLDPRVVPLIKPLVLANEGSLPEFCLTSSHKLSGDPNPFYGFPSQTKFFLLRRFGNEYLRGFGNGSVVHAGMQDNALASNVVSLVAALMTFGFQSTHDKIKELLEYLVRVLDGRSDVEDFHKPFEPPSARYQLTPVSPAVTSLKFQVVKILTEVSNLRANFRLAKLLHIFQAYIKDSKIVNNLKKLHAHVIDDTVYRFGESVPSGEAFFNKLYQDFEELFEVGDGKALDLTVLANGLPVDVILLDCLCYQDDALFAAALELLERTYGQRRKLLHAISEVTLLETEVVPVFGNVAEMSSELGFMLFLVRSFEVWGVSSRVSGPFQPEKFDLVVRTCDRISQYLFQANNLEVEETQANSTLPQAKVPKKKILSSSSLGDGDINDTKAVSRHGFEVDATIGEDSDFSYPSTFHQNVMRSMNLLATLVAALNMDYNLSFRGSICSAEDKLRSRDMLVHAKRKLIECLSDFVKGNRQNQDEVVNHLPQLRKHLGQLKLPPTWPDDFTEAHRAKVNTMPGLNAEGVIIECLRNNVDVCQMKVPRDLLEEFGVLVNAEVDPSACMQLELFQLMCLPEGFGFKALPRNQGMVLDVLLSDNLQHLKACFDDVFFGDAQGEKPERLVLLLAAAICNNNFTTAAQLQGKKIGIEATVAKMHTLLVNACMGSYTGLSDRGKISRDTEVTALSTHPLFSALLIFLADQLDVLVVDPKIFRADKTWLVVCVGCSRLLSACLDSITTCTPALAHATTAACRVAVAFLEGSRSLGLKIKEAAMAHELVEGDKSMYASATMLSSSAHLKAHPSLKDAAIKLARIFKPTTTVPVNLSFNRNVLENKMGSDDNLQGELGWHDLGGITRGRAGTLTGLQEGFNSVEMPTSMPPSDVTSVHAVDDSASNKGESVATMCNYFHEALQTNPLVKAKLQSRRFELVGILERAEELTGKGGKTNKVPGGEGQGACTITWTDVVHRMVKFIEAHNFDADEDPSLRCLRILRMHLFKARSDSTGMEREASELPKEARLAYKEKQSAFVDLGVATVALTCVATHAANVEGNLADEGLELLLEMMNDGNKVVQDAIITHIEYKDRENKFLLHLEHRMRASARDIELRKERTFSDFESMSKEARETYRNAAQTFLTMKILCKGHNEEAQNILRYQATNIDVNTVASAAGLVSLLCNTSKSLRNMEGAELELVVFGLDFLVEAVLGPCVGNQELLATHEGLIHALDKILQSKFDVRVSLSLRLQAKATAAKLIQGLLEGRHDMTVHNILGKELEPMALEKIEVYAAKILEQSRANVNTPVSDGMVECFQLSLELMTSIKTILMKLVLVPEFNDKFQDVRRRKTANMPTDLVGSTIEVVEVLWHDRIERIAFPVPSDTAYLTRKSKSDFILNSDLSTAEKRMKQLFTEAPVLMAEMQQIYTLSKWSKIYAFINQNIINIKWSMYALVVLLNINIVMASYGAERTEGYRSIVDGLSGLEDDRYKNSLYASLVLATINLLGYVIIVTFLAITEVPIIIRRLDDYVHECLESLTMRDSDYRDKGAFTWWGVTLLFNVLFIIMHLYNYPDKPNYSLYNVMVFGINLPWTLSCIRNYIVVPNTPGTRLFCIAYDVIITKPFFRNHVILMFFSINGYTQSVYFPLMLMDIMNNSKTLANITRSMTDNLGALGWVLYLFICTVVIYAQFGLQYFEDYFHYNTADEDGESVGCHSVVSCFFLILYVGVPGGRLDEVLDAVSNRDQPDYLMRVVFDTSFFIWVGVLLFNIITGLMVDGFGSLREEDKERSDILENTCFVCGFNRTSYEDIPNFRGPNFDYHKSEEHNFWSYVDLYVYLKRRDESSYSGAESYVWFMMNKGDLSWIPRRTSASIQDAQVAVEKGV